MPRGDAPADDTLQMAMDEIERTRRQLAEQRMQIAKLRAKIAELARSGATEAPQNTKRPPDEAAFLLGSLGKPSISAIRRPA
jgi:uncharacterized coiled-coil protein SlyX